MNDSEHSGLFIIYWAYLPRLTLQFGIGVEKGGEGLGYAGDVVYEDRGVGAPGGYGEGHRHTVVVRGGIFTALEEVTVQEAALD